LLAIARRLPHGIAPAAALWSASVWGIPPLVPSLLPSLPPPSPSPLPKFSRFRAHGPEPCSCLAGVAGMRRARWWCWQAGRVRAAQPGAARCRPRRPPRCGASPAQRPPSWALLPPTAPAAARPRTPCWRRALRRGRRPVRCCRCCPRPRCRRASRSGRRGSARRGGGRAAAGLGEGAGAAARRRRRRCRCAGPPTHTPVPACHPSPPQPTV
jgi:hypothetical protein